MAARQATSTHSSERAPGRTPPRSLRPPATRPPLRRRPLLVTVLLSLLLGAPAAAAPGDPDTAALQVALRARALYDGSVDGLVGPATTAAVAAFQRQQELPVTGLAGPLTRAALGPLALNTLGDRPIGVGCSGWDVAELQFSLAWHGFPSGPLDGDFTPETQAALLRYQQWAGLQVDGVAGPAVFAALRAPLQTAPVRFAWPVALPVADRFGPRGGRFHAGIDIPAPAGEPVTAALGGRVVYAGWRDGGWGNEVTIANGNGVRELYAHLSQVDVLLGATVRQGDAIGLVGSTGDATGPHLHFEVRLRGAAVDPLPSLAPTPTPALPAPPPTRDRGQPSQD